MLASSCFAPREKAARDGVVDLGRGDHHRGAHRSGAGDGNANANDKGHARAEAGSEYTAIGGRM